MADRIALVDDDQNILTSVALALESEGFEVDSYSDIEAALASIKRRKVDLAVLDIKMPRMDGSALLQKLRNQSQLPVIFLSSKDDELEEALGLGMGAELGRGVVSRVGGGIGEDVGRSVSLGVGLGVGIGLGASVGRDVKRCVDLDVGLAVGLCVGPDVIIWKMKALLDTAPTTRCVAESATE